MKPLKGTNDLVFTDRGRLYTASANPGIRVYGERLVTVDGTEYREWSPERSKLSAYLMSGGTTFPFKKDSTVLYLGAASGTTSSHVSDIVSEGHVYCVEFSPRSFRDLVRTSSGRKNMHPILGDATNPDEYAFILDHADIVYADVAQKRQADILIDNMERFDARCGMVSIKARSEDVTADPNTIFHESAKRMKERGCRVTEIVSLEPYENAHAMIVLEKPRTAYCVAIKDSKFLMVHNLKRGGWEMPGGKTEPGETPEDTAKRECLEESGYDTTFISMKNLGYCDVCACILNDKATNDCEMESALFDTLPNDLSFDTDEYEDVIAWARKCVAER